MVYMVVEQIKIDSRYVSTIFRNPCRIQSAGAVENTDCFSGEG